MKKMIENYRKPTPEKWRKFGDTMLLLVLAVEPTIASMPIENPKAKEWIVWGCTSILVLLKFWSNTKVNPNKYES